MDTRLQDQFNISSIVVKKMKKTPTNDELLELYSLYKQATTGDCNTPKPSFLNIREKSKWNSWKKLSGMEKKHAMFLYVKLVEKLVKIYN